MMQKLLMTILAASTLFVSPAAAQGLGHRLTLHGGFSIPIGDYAKTTDEPNSGFAQLGFGAGIEYDLRFGDSGLSWSSGFTYLTNDYQADQFSRGLDILLQESGSYSNFALFTGVKYEKRLGDNMRLFAVAQGGASLARGPYFNGFYEQENQELQFVEFQLGRDITGGYVVGVGMIANETTTVLLRYFNLGSPVFSGRASYQIDGNDQTAAIEWAQPVSVIAVTIGYAIELGL